MEGTSAKATGSASWPGRSAGGSVVLPLAGEGHVRLPSRLTLPEARLERKAEFHLTLLSRAEAEALAGTLPEASWAAVFRRLAWGIEATRALLLLRRSEGSRACPGADHSVVRRLACPSLGLFRRTLSERAGLALPAPFAHVTLFVAGSPRGIAVPSHEVLRSRLVRCLDPRETAVALGEATRP